MFYVNKMCSVLICVLSVFVLLSEFIKALSDLLKSTIVSEGLNVYGFINAFIC